MRNIGLVDSDVVGLDPRMEVLILFDGMKGLVGGDTKDNSYCGCGGMDGWCINQLILKTFRE